MIENRNVNIITDADGKKLGMSRPPQARRSRCLDILCASCYKT